jgi:DNA-binding MarR family transcriptional regulator
MLIGRKHGWDYIVSRMLQKLEDDGFIKIKIDADGDKEIIPISEIERDAKT